ncbi:MAG: hypothetical protein EBZ67_08210 [Chitinophagia bacterium]|nr:hypothetical protein [Chitinophagia bacterium]
MSPTRPLLLIGLVFFVVLSVRAQAPQNTGFFGNVTAAGEVCSQNGSFLSETEVNQLVTEMLGRIGAKNRYVIVACPQLENCQATLYQGRPYILYNPGFLGRVKRLNFSGSSLPQVSGKDWETLTILAHELGHHINNHILNPLPDATQRDRELEADESAGFMIYLMGGSLAEASHVFALVPEEGNYTHPGRQQRMASVKKGWEDASKKYPRATPAPSPSPVRTVEPAPVKPDPAPIRTRSGWEHAEAFSRDLVRVEGGSFRMGCTVEQGKDCEPGEKPSRMVTVGTFHISRYEVTQRQWTWVMGSNPSAFPGCDDCPVENVSWIEIQSFLKKLNEKMGGGYRLPTEAEWEYAARGGMLSKGFKYAGGDDALSVGWNKANSDGRPHPVGQKPANELGLHDMTGNVWEWCQDWWARYPTRPETDPKGPVNGGGRVLRGSGWNLDPVHSRVTGRTLYADALRSENLGFRLAFQAR